ncbi:MAG TPA: hypothetical protein VL358_04760 [Caulobacteraceae bacterium]|jgi:hypothetical protein|nr:hypothetical protein [Caulobacteraceae bacterium]
MPQTQHLQIVAVGGVQLGAHRPRPCPAEDAVEETLRKLRAVLAEEPANRGPVLPAFREPLTADQRRAEVAWMRLCLIGPPPIVAVEPRRHGDRRRMAKAMLKLWREF